MAAKNIESDTNEREPTKNWRRMNCYLFDIDNTLACNKHRLHHIEKSPKDWDTFFAEMPDDPPIRHMVDLASLIGRDNTVVYVTGRPAKYNELTRQWLVANGLPQGSIYSRPDGDRRNDDIIKMELLAVLRKDGFEPVMVFDDRTRVVNAWRAAGIPCCQVAPGDL